MLQLKQRVFTSHSNRRPSVHPSLSSRPEKYKLWEDYHMDKAFDACGKEGMTIREAALRFGVPKLTLGDRVSGRVLPGATSGPKAYLRTDEEEELVRFLLRCAAIGYPKSRKEVLATVQSAMERKGRFVAVTNGWWESFCRRHPNLTLRIPAPLSKARSAASDPDIVSRYFDLLEETMLQNDLLDKPCQVFNIDESGMPLDPKQMRCVYNRGDRNPLAPSSGDKAQITVVACVSASGMCIPPMVILDRKTLPAYFSDGEVPGSIYGLSPKGWIDQELFDVWFCNHFLRYAPMARPLLLLLDGHSSHYCPETIRLAAKEQVIVFALPPHTTHFSQPLDKGCFGPLKLYWRQDCHNFMSRNPGMTVSRYNFSQLFSAAWFKAMTISNVIGGFKVTGVFPLNRGAVKLPQQNLEKLAEQSGLAFIPLYSPARPRKLQVVSFSPEEHELYNTRYENGYDLHDERYNTWLRQYHPEEMQASKYRSESSLLCLSLSTVSHSGSCESPNDSYREAELLTSRGLSRRRSVSCHRAFRSESPSPVRQSVQLLRPHYGSMGYLLKIPSPPPRRTAPAVKSCGRVLTNAENIKRLEEKEEKREKARQKEERKRLREEKRLAKIEETKQKKEQKKQKELSRLAAKEAVARKREEQKQQREESRLAKLRQKKKAVAAQEGNSGNEETGFTLEEHNLYHKRYENGYDLHDERYNAWLHKHHPEELQGLSYNSDGSTKPQTKRAVVCEGGLPEIPSAQAGARSPGASLATRGTKPRTRRGVALEGDSPEIPSSQGGARSAGASGATRGTKPQTKKGVVRMGGSPETPSSQPRMRSAGASVATRGTKPQRKKAVVCEGGLTEIPSSQAGARSPGASVATRRTKPQTNKAVVLEGDSPEIPSSQAGARSAGASVATRGTKPQRKKAVVCEGGSPEISSTTM